MHNFKRLKIWQDAMQLCKLVYVATEKFPDFEKFGLANQLRRASVSIASNIAEGSSRSSEKDFYRFLEIAHGSGFEVETQIMIASELNYLDKADVELLAKRVSGLQRMIYKFKQKFNSNKNS